MRNTPGVSQPRISCSVLLQFSMDEKLLLWTWWTIISIWIEFDRNFLDFCCLNHLMMSPEFNFHIAMTYCLPANSLDDMNFEEVGNAFYRFYAAVKSMNWDVLICLISNQFIKESIDVCICLNTMHTRDNKIPIWYSILLGLHSWNVGNKCVITI